MQSRLDLLEDATQSARFMAAGVLVGSILLGCYTTIIALSYYILYHRGLRSIGRMTVFCASGLMYALAIVYYTISTSKALMFIFQPEQAVEMSISTVEARNSVLTICLGVTMWLSDSIILWRAAVIYGPCRKIKLVSLAIWLIVTLSATTTAATALFLAHPKSRFASDPGLPHPVSNMFGTATVGISFIANVWAVVLLSIKAKEHWHLRRLVPSSEFAPWRILAFLAACGTIYCILYLAFLFSYAVGTLPFVIAMDSALVQVTGIVPTLTVVVACLQKAEQAPVSADVRPAHSPSRSQTSSSPSSEWPSVDPPKPAFVRESLSTSEDEKRPAQEMV